MANKILGIDPGSQLLGWAVIQTSPLTYVSSGVLKITPKDFYERVGFIIASLNKIFHEENPDFLVLEKAFVGVNKEVALKLGQIRGAVMAFGNIHQLGFAEYAPRQAKKTVTGYGAATKDQIFRVCKMSLKNMPDNIKSFDQSDAIALALCHHYTSQSHQVWAR